MYEFYTGDIDPRLWESEAYEDPENSSECPNGCGFWRGQYLIDGACPECGDYCHDIVVDDVE